jgi:metallo-beta-lactamase family protein
MPILRDPTPVPDADLVLLESTYGERLHRSHADTLTELGEVLHEAARVGGNVLIPSFAVGRTQDLLYLFAEHRVEWGIASWQIFLDSPMAIEATEVYARHVALYDTEAAMLWDRQQRESQLPNLHFTRTAAQSMRLNRIRSGAIIIAGSGMCDGGRIRHHLKHNIWRRDCSLILVGFQAKGTTGRALVDGARYIRLWGETIRVGASVHTIGGLSAHADQDGLVDWYAQFNGRPPVLLVHGERPAQEVLAQRLTTELAAPARPVRLGESVDLSAEL